MDTNFTTLSDMRAAITAKETAYVMEHDRQVREMVERFTEEVRAKFGPALDELSPIFSYDNQPVVTLTYRGSERAYGKQITPDKLAEWMDYVDAESIKNEQYSQSKRAQVLARMSHEPTSDSDWWTDEIAKYNLEEFEDVRLALEAYKVKVETLRQREEQKRLEKEAAKLAEWTQAIQIAGTMEDRSQWHRLQEWFNSNLYDFPSSEVYNELDEALARADERIRHIEAEQEQKRARVEAARFYPFRWYSAVYGVVASDDNETYVEQEEFRSLRADQDPGGWWHGVYGKAVRLAHLIKVERNECRSIEDLPDWCPSENTEFGRIRVPPADAERIRGEA